mgnify:CR=1 FL=1
MTALSSQERENKILQLKINAAKAFIAEGRQAVAITILEAIDDPRADRLLEKIGVPAPDDPRPAALQSTAPFLAIVTIVGVVCFALGILSNNLLTRAVEQDPETTFIEETLPDTPVPQALELVIPTLTIDPQLDISRTEVVATFEAYHMGLTATQAIVGATQTASSQEE